LTDVLATEYNDAVLLKEVFKKRSMTMKVVIQGNRLDLDISHVEVDEEREILVLPIMEDAINLEVNVDDLAELAQLAYQNFQGLQ